MEWSKPKQQGMIPAPRAGHAGIAVGENWFIVGGGDNKNGRYIILLVTINVCVFQSLGKYIYMSI